MRPKTLKQKLFLTVSILVITSGMSISLLVTHRYSTSLIQGAVAQAQNITHNLALDAVDKILINDLVALQKLLDDQMRSDPSIAYLFVVKDDRIIWILPGRFSPARPGRFAWDCLKNRIKAG
jgi:two-component system response regulator HydG